MSKELQIFADNGSSMLTGKEITGAAVLSQRLLVILLTNVNESLRQGEGTVLPTLLYNGVNGYDQSTMEGMIAIAADAAVTAYAQDVTDDTPDTERISSYKLEDITRDIDTIKITMRLTTVAGESYAMEGAIA